MYNSKEGHHVELVVGVHHVEQLHHVLVLQLLQQRDLADGRRRNSLRLSESGRGRGVRTEETVGDFDNLTLLTIVERRRNFSGVTCAQSNPHQRTTRASEAESENVPLLDSDSDSAYAPVVTWIFTNFGSSVLCRVTPRHGDGGG